MKITTVRYGRNFYIGRYDKEMEYFNIEASVGEGENEKQVFGELFFKIMKVHEIFEEYRKLLQEIPETEKWIESIKETMQEAKQELEEFEKLEQKLKQAKNIEEMQEIQQELCRFTPKKVLQKRILEKEEKLENLEQKLKELEARKAYLETTIKQGNY